MTDDNRTFRFLHTMIRVKDLEKSLDFYTRHLATAIRILKVFSQISRNVMPGFSLSTFSLMLRES